MTNEDQLISNTTAIVAAMVGARLIGETEVGPAIGRIADALARIGRPPVAEPEAVAKPTPAVPVRGSVKPDHVVSLIDGKPYKTLKRHLAKNGYTPDSYRAAFGLPASYPMVAASYSEKRKVLAISSGLGRKG